MWGRRKENRERERERASECLFLLKVQGKRKEGRRNERSSSLSLSCLGMGGERWEKEKSE